ncbi:head-tail adaptor protein [Sphingomonas arantia]|uniref:Head-tail adaptor protein n=1 Tax=Sphingomonas arantia TaxID=1460676 RepID=A0ABW4TZT3_9SPHN
MSAAGLAGLLRERVTVLRGDPARDAQGGVSGVFTLVGTVWAGCVPDGERRWRIAMRPCDVAVGDRIGRVAMQLRVVRVLADPRMPDRITLFAEEEP